MDAIFPLKVALGAKHNVPLDLQVPLKKKLKIVLKISFKKSEKFQASKKMRRWV